MTTSGAGGASLRGGARGVLLFALLALLGCGSTTSGPSPGSAAGRSLSSPNPGSGTSPAPSVSPSPGGLVLTPVPATPETAPGPLTAPAVVKVAPGGTQLAAGPSGRGSGTLRAGVVVPVTAVEGGWAKILTPCEIIRWVPVGSVRNLGRPQVVLDPGHGGGESGAVGPGGLAEKTVNLPVAARAAELLAAQGIPAVLTRTDDYRATLGFRAELARAARPRALISIHHNAEPDGAMDRPGTETYYQIGSDDSKRLAGLMYEEAIRVLSALKAQWVGDRDAGAKWRPNDSGGDYYGILRRPRQAGVTAILAEFAFVSNPSEEALLAKQETQALEAQAIAQAVTRYLGTKDPGSGFTTPYPRKEPAGPGGGRTGCTDPS